VGLKWGVALALLPSAHYSLQFKNPYTCPVLEEAGKARKQLLSSIDRSTIP